MKNCTACNQQIPSEVKFCPECGTKQEIEVPKEVEHTPEIPKPSETSLPRKPLPKLLVVAMVLAIIFSIFIGILGLWYLLVGDTMHKDQTAYMGIAWTVASIVTIIGAVMMVRRIKKGYYLYMITQVLLIIAIVLEIMMSNADSKSQPIVLPLTLFLLIPALTFAVIFYASKSHKYLY